MQLLSIVEGILVAACDCDRWDNVEMIGQCCDAQIELTGEVLALLDGTDNEV
jgi:hypothetical protein